jgi:single-strand DNA-binding protein
MATTVTFKLNKDATQFPAGESVGFGIRGGVKYYDRQTKQDAYTNFEAVIFAKQQRQIEFYQSALVAGSIVEVTGQKLAIKQFQGNNGLSLSIELLDASIGFIGTAGTPQAQGQQQGYQQPPQQQRPQQNGYAQASGGMQRPQQQQMQQGGYQSYDEAPPF